MVLRSNGVIFSTLRGLGGIQFCCWLDFLMDGESKYLQKPKHVWNGGMLINLIGRPSPAHSFFSLPTCLLHYFCVTPFLVHASCSPPAFHNSLPSLLCSSFQHRDHSLSFSYIQASKEWVRKTKSSHSEGSPVWPSLLDSTLVPFALSSFRSFGFLGLFWHWQLASLVAKHFCKLSCEPQKFNSSFFSSSNKQLLIHLQS